MTKARFLCPQLRRQSALSFVLHLAGVAPPGIQCPFDLYKICKLDFLLLEVKKASTMEVNLLLGDCQSLLCEAFEVLWKGCLLFANRFEEFSRGKDNLDKIGKPQISLLLFGFVFVVVMIVKSYGFYQTCICYDRRLYI